MSADAVYCGSPSADLQEGWRWTSIESLISEEGTFCDGDWVESKDQDPDGDVRLIQLADVGVAVFRDRSDRSLTLVRASELKCTFLCAGDILVARMPDPLGRACIFPGSQRPCVTVVDVAIVRPKNSDVDGRWLMHRINGKDFREAVASLQSGSTRLRISRKNLARIHFLLPPLDEQRRIVAEIEKQFSRLDEAVANLQRVKANLKRYKAAILKAAVEGRLVETEASLAHREGRTYETGVDLLALMLSAQGELKQGRGRKSNSSDAMGGANATLPDGWVWATLGQFLSERIVNGLSIKESTDPTEVRALRLSAMRGESIDFTDFRYLPISPYKVHDILIQAGDVFVSRGNGSLDLVGRACTAGTPPLPTIFPDTMMRLRFTQTAPVAAWVRAIWHSRSIREQIESRVKTTAGIYKIAQPELASVLVPLPPLAEQKRITTESDRRLSFLRVVEAEVDANLLRAQRLRQATLSKAFVPNESK